MRQSHDAPQEVSFNTTLAYYTADRPGFIQASEPHLAVQHETGGLQSTSAALVGFSIDYPAQQNTRARAATIK